MRISDWSSDVCSSDLRLHLCLSDGSAAMSADPHAAAHTHDDHHEIEMPHASMRDYVIGFILSVILTAIPFWLVMTMPLSAGATGAIIMGFAVVPKIGRASCGERGCQYG